MRRSSKRKSAEGQIILLSLGWGPKRGPGPSRCLIHPSAWKGNSAKFGCRILFTTIAYRRRERWAWFALWYYPVFWTAHLVGGLPPGKDHVHQVVFIVVSLAGLLLPVREFFPRRGARELTTS